MTQQSSSGESFSPRGGVETLSPLRRIQDSLTALREAALRSQEKSLINRYIADVEIRALDETDAYYYELLEEGKLDDQDLDEYSRHIHSFGSRGAQVVVDGRAVDLIQNKKNFLDWLKISLCPEGKLDPEKAGVWVEDLMDREGLLGSFDSANLTKDDLDFFAQFIRGEAVRKELQNMRNGIEASLNERIKRGMTPEIDMKPFHDRFRFYEFLISKSSQ